MIQKQEHQTKIPKLRFREFQGEWKTEKMRKLTTLITNGFVGKATDHYVEENGVLYIQGYNVHETGFDYHGIKFVSRSFHEKHKKSTLREGDLLTIQTGDVGVTGYVTPELVGSNCHALIISRYTEGIAYSRFYHQYFNSHIGRGLLKTIETGSTMKHLNCGDMEKLDLPLTSFGEQQKIASFLSLADKKIEKLKTKKSFLEKYKKGVMQKIFSRELRFRDENGNEFGEWEKKRINEICTKSSSNLSANSLNSTNTGNYKIYGASGVWGTADFYQEASGYVAIVKDGAGVGRISLCDKYTSTLGTLDKIIPNDGLVLEFLYYLLQGVNINSFVTGSTIPHIYFKDYSKLIIQIPIQKEQQKIASFLFEIDKKIEAINREIKITEKWKKGLLQGMFI